MKKSTRSNPPRSDAGNFGRLQRKPRASHSWEREASRIEKSNSKFTSLSGGGQSYLETRDDGTQPRHPDLTSREVGTLKAGKADRAK
jgi:hypothetical protein